MMCPSHIAKHKLLVYSIATMKQPTTSELRIYPDEVDNTAMALDFLSEVRPELRLSLLFSFINQARLEADKRHLGRIAAVMLGTEDQLSKC